MKYGYLKAKVDGHIHLVMPDVNGKTMCGDNPAEEHGRENFDGRLDEQVALVTCPACLIVIEECLDYARHMGSNC